MAITDFNSWRRRMTAVEVRIIHRLKKSHTAVEESGLHSLKSSHYICWKFRITTIEEVALRWWIRIIQQLKRSYFSCWMFRITTVGNIRLQQSVMTRCTLHHEIQIKLLDEWNYKDQQVCKFTRLNKIFPILVFFPSVLIK